LFRLGAELDLLGLDRRRVLPSLLLLLGLLVLVLAVVHDPAHRRERARRDLDEIEPLLLRHAHRLVRRQDAELGAVVRDDADLRNADAMVDTKARLGAAAVEATAVRSAVHGETWLGCMVGVVLRFTWRGGSTASSAPRKAQRAPRVEAPGRVVGTCGIEPQTP